jgi:hypothetical protein
MPLHIVNYFVRGLIVIIGIILLSGVFKPQGDTSYFMQVMGVIFLIFGTYRLISYYSVSQRYKSLNTFSEDEDENDNQQTKDA